MTKSWYLKGDEIHFYNEEIERKGVDGWGGTPPKERERVLMTKGFPSLYRETTSPKVTVETTRDPNVWTNHTFDRR